MIEDEWMTLKYNYRIAMIRTESTYDMLDFITVLRLELGTSNPTWLSTVDEYVRLGDIPKVDEEGLDRIVTSGMLMDEVSSIVLVELSDTLVM